MGISYGAIRPLFAAQLAFAATSIRPTSRRSHRCRRSTRQRPRFTPERILNTGFAVAVGRSSARRRAQSRPGRTAASRTLPRRSRTAIRPASPTRSSTARREPDGQDRRQLALQRLTVADPLDPISFVDKIKVPVFMACQWEDEQTGGHLPRPSASTSPAQAQVVHVHQRRARRLTRPVHVRPLVRLLRAVRRASRRRSSTRGDTCRRAGDLPIGDGAPKPTRSRLPVDPIQLEPTYQSALSAFEALPEVRRAVRQRRGYLADRQHDRGRPRTPDSSNRSRRSRSRARPLAGGISDPPETHASPPAHKGIDWYTSNAKAVPLNDFPIADTEAAVSGERIAVAVELAAEPGRHRDLVRLRATQVEHHGDRRRRCPPVGAVLDTGRRPSGDDQRGAARRNRDVRAERMATSRRAQALDQHEQHPAPEEHPARPDPQHAQLRRAADAEGPLRRGRHTALLRGPRVPRRLADPVTISAPNGTQPVWSFGQTDPSGTAKVSWPSPGACRRA